MSPGFVASLISNAVMVQVRFEDMQDYDILRAEPLYRQNVDTPAGRYGTHSRSTREQQSTRREPCLRPSTCNPQLLPECPTDDTWHFQLCAAAAVFSDSEHPEAQEPVSPVLQDVTQALRLGRVCGQAPSSGSNPLRSLHHKYIGGVGKVPITLGS